MCGNVLGEANEFRDLGVNVKMSFNVDINNVVTSTLKVLDLWLEIL